MTESATLSLPEKARLASRIWIGFLAVRIGLMRHQLPALVTSFHDSTVMRPVPTSPIRLSRIVSRTLSLGPFRPRCLVAALVLFRLLRAQGERAQLVIGLPERPLEKDAHAWVEIDGTDIGPAPGRNGHRELARYG